MKVTKKTLRKFEIEFTASEVNSLSVVSSQAGVKQENLVEHLLSSGLCHAGDAARTVLFEGLQSEVDEDGNSITDL